jgi:hypothetical protein
MKSLSETARAILVKESDDPTPDRDSKLMTPNKATLRPGAKAVEGRFANPGAMSPGEGEYEDLGPAAVNPTDVPPSAKAAGGSKKDTSKSAQAAVPAEPSMMEEEVEISEELEAFINQMMEEGYSEEEISEAIAENFEIVEEKDEDEKEDEDEEEMDEETEELNELSKGTLALASLKAKAKANKAHSEMYTKSNPNQKGSDFNPKMAELAKKKADQADKFEKAASMKEHVDALLAGENLSEDFRTKAETLFESAVSVRVNEEVAVLEEAYEKALEEEVSTIMETLTEQVDGYLGYVVEQWLKENEIAIEHGLRTEITEEFISGLKTLFAENYIDIPTEKIDIAEELGSKVEELQKQLNEEIERGIELSSALTESRKFEAFALACDGLTATDAEKLRTLAEGIEAGSSEEFANKLEIIKESYFTNAPTTASKKSAPLDLIEDRGSASSETLVESMSGPMAAYVKSLDRSLVKKSK